MMAEQSNLYYKQNKYKYQCFSKSRKTVITSDKMKKFIGIIFLMDHMVKKNLKDYRLTDSLGEMSIFSKFMNGN